MRGVFADLVDTRIYVCTPQVPIEFTGAKPLTQPPCPHRRHIEAAPRCPFSGDQSHIAGPDPLAGAAAAAAVAALLLLLHGGGAWAVAGNFDFHSMEVFITDMLLNAELYQVIPAAVAT